MNKSRYDVECEGQMWYKETKAYKDAEDAKEAKKDIIVGTITLDKVMSAIRALDEKLELHLKGEL